MFEQIFGAQQPVEARAIVKTRQPREGKANIGERLVAIPPMLGGAPINHQEAYSTDEACTNQAESFFSRLRRAEFGIHHHISGRYLAAYASEMAWRENNRRISNGEQYLMTADLALAHPVSREWKGYWQR